MKLLGWKSVVVLASMTLVSLGCSQGIASDTPPESAAREVYEKWLAQSFGQGIAQIDSFKKTNAIKKDEGGVQIYDLEFAAEISFPKGFMPECVGRKYSYIDHTAVDQKCYEALQAGLTPAKAGAKDSGTGFVRFEKAENGWRGKGVKLD